MKTPGRFPLTILVGLAACTWVAVAVGLYGAQPDIGFFKPMSIVTGVISTGLAGFDRWLWRIPGLSAVHGVPDLNGTWFGEIRSMWTDPSTGKSPPSIPTAIIIRQTYTAVSVRMFTGESTSVSIAAGLAPEADGQVVVTYLYRSEPRLSIQDRSRVHHGGVKVALGGAGDALEGSYWTDRSSKGEMTLRRISRWHELELDAATKLAGGPSSSSPPPSS